MIQGIYRLAPSTSREGNIQQRVYIKGLNEYKLTIAPSRVATMIISSLFSLIHILHDGFGFKTCFFLNSRIYSFNSQNHLLYVVFQF